MSWFDSLLSGVDRIGTTYERVTAGDKQRDLEQQRLNLEADIQRERLKLEQQRAAQGSAYTMTDDQVQTYQTWALGIAAGALVIALAWKVLR